MKIMSFRTATTEISQNFVNLSIHSTELAVAGGLEIRNPKEKIPTAMMANAFIALSVSTMQNENLSLDAKRALFESTIANLGKMGYSDEAVAKFTFAISEALNLF